MKDSVKITVPSHPKYLAMVRRMTFMFGDVHGMENTLLEDIKLAVDEACTNVIRHAYGGDQSRTIGIEYQMKEGELRVTIEDNGLKADINKIRGRNLDDLRPGGLGVHFIKKVFDIFRFDRRKKTGNRLILIKKVHH